MGPKTPKPPKTIQNPTKPHKTNPFPSLLPKQQNRNYSWGMWPLNHTWKITPLANKEPISPNMGQHGPQNPTSSCVLLSVFFQCFTSFSWWISWNILIFFFPPQHGSRPFGRWSPQPVSRFGLPGQRLRAPKRQTARPGSGGQADDVGQPRAVVGDGCGRKKPFAA